MADLHRSLIGFTLLSHSSSAQLKRLIEALNREYDEPPIACHHDFGQSPLDPADFSKNVHFVRPHFLTGWGRFSIVQATLAAIKLLYSFERRPDWFIHLSASDYPVRCGRDVRHLLAAAECDAFLDARALEPGATAKASLDGAPNNKLVHFSSPQNECIKRRFYTSREIWIPLIRTKPRLRLGRYTIRTSWRVKGVYDDFPAFYGDHWFCANAKVAEMLCTPSERHSRLQRHLARRTQVDETYFQTLIMNQPGLKVFLDNKRFAEWNGGGAHPMLLEERQLQQILSSGAFFARKFVAGSPILDRIDAALRG